MTVLVTGGAGYIGSHVVHGLLEEKQPVIVLDNLASGFRKAVPAEATLVVGDVSDQGLVATLIAEHGVSAIMHFAASTVVPESVANPIAYYRNNAAGSLALIDAAIRGGVGRFVFSSTAAVYGNPATARNGMEIFGTDYPTPDGTCIRDYIHVCDLVSAHVKALDYLRGGGASVTLNCGYGHGYSVLEIIEAVKRVSGSDFAATPRPRRAGDPAAIVADSRLIRQLLSWVPAYDDLDTIVGHALAWERKPSVQ